MSVNAVTAAMSQGADTPAAQSAPKADFDAFLTMLTAQVRHQDPLAPLDSTQFVEQLATFSSVEQQVETNKHLEAIAEMLSLALQDQV
ncbi:flagellar hook assembly protein FlgD [Parvularcula dongshanensis]|uniref:Basal-body rod modification protein FlgD n=1 Tax=Parvularcula dongshanensis TaxID=1173995 RepID=A0A840I621_9PROT|nr:flagellar hook capping FlgD N-terminal domain-containing protein [Parvularcula dongshanensis]MBB4659634.1 flagellar hook assembly protein FlgD [Parvularcula dongshanensis]